MLLTLHTNQDFWGPRSTSTPILEVLPSSDIAPSNILCRSRYHLLFLSIGAICLFVGFHLLSATRLLGLSADVPVHSSPLPNFMSPSSNTPLFTSHQNARLIMRLRRTDSVLLGGFAIFRTIRPWVLLPAKCCCSRFPIARATRP